MATRRQKATRKAKSDSVYQLKVRLLECDPPIWRQVQVPPDITLGDLNFVLQACMGWTNSHLHQFTVDDIRYSDPRFEPDESGDERDEFGVTLERVAPAVGSQFLFLYDFGDGWEHSVVVEAIVPREPETTYPVCLAGARACPPDDCGGVWGYAEFLEAIRNPKHEEHEEMLEWVGGEFDPEEFDIDELNGHLIDSAAMMASWQ